MKNGNNDEKIGRTVFRISYLLYALKFICTVSLAALVILWLFKLDLRLAPIIGIAVFLIYRTARRIIIGSFIKLARWGDKESGK